MTRADPDERDELIRATLANYISGHIGDIRAEASLAVCNLNAKEIDELLSQHRITARKNYRLVNSKGPVR